MLAFHLIWVYLGASSQLESISPPTSPVKIPTSFADGRYEVKEFLGEGGKKKVYKAYDTSLDREVALALIKLEGLDEDSRTRITREAQAMGRLGAHTNIVTVFDLGNHEGQGGISGQEFSAEVVTEDGKMAIEHNAGVII